MRSFAVSYVAGDAHLHTGGIRTRGAVAAFMIERWTSQHTPRPLFLLVLDGCDLCHSLSQERGSLSQEVQKYLPFLCIIGPVFNHTAKILAESAKVGWYTRSGYSCMSEGDMAHTETRYERLDTIERLLAQSHEGLTSGELARHLAVDQSTIVRDLTLLESRGTGLIKDGWRYRLDHRRSLYTVKMTSHELLALFLAVRLLSRHSDEHNPHVVHALEKLADAFREKSARIAHHIDRTAEAVRSRKARPAYVEALEALTYGWVSCKKVDIAYRNAQGGTSERCIHPYFLEPSGIGYACYVIAFDEKDGMVKTFKVERMSEATLTEDDYTIPETFNPQQLLANAWGVMWRDEGSIDVALHFSAQVTRRVRESVWHHTQELHDLPDGSCVLRVQVGSTKEMTPWIGQWGADVVVLEPEALRTQLAEESAQLARMYGWEVGHA